MPIEGLVAYNTTANTWSNDSSTGISPFGTSINGGLQFIPQFGTQAGTDGLLIALGGEFSGPEVWSETGSNFMSFSNISIYDIASKSWFWQTATGNAGPTDIPPQGSRFCITGTKSPQGTFEIFIFGGYNDTLLLGNTTPDLEEANQQEGFNTVYVLSLPGFVWFKSNDTTAEPRAGHSCELVGNRQMLSIGGINPSKNTSDGFASSDTFPQGLGIFDMVQMKWTTSYDAHAAPYTLPATIQSWYNQP